MPASSYVNREHVGGAVDTTITGDITGSSLTIGINSAVGWPTGGANGPFHVIVDYDVAGKEKVEVQSRTGTTLTIADTGKRGIDGTAAASHTTGATIRHCLTAIDMQEANDHITNTALDHHTQYHTAARHAAVTHTAAMLGTDSVGSDEIAASAVGSTELASGAVTAGKIAAGGISAASQFASGVVDAAAIATDAVGSAELANNAVDTNAIANLAVTGAKIAVDTVNSSNIAAGAIDQSTDLADGVVTLAKLASEGGTNYTPTVTGLTGGSNTIFGRSYKLGRLVVGNAGFIIGAGGNITAEIQFELPYTAATITNMIWLGGGRGFIAGGRWASIGFINSAGTVIRGFATGGFGAWDGTVPNNWDVGDSMQCFFMYEAAS